MENFTLKYILVFSLSCISLNSCGQPYKKSEISEDGKQKWDASVQGSFVQKNKLALDSTEIVDFFKKYPKLKEVEKDLFTFYNGREYAYA